MTFSFKLTDQTDDIKLTACGCFCERFLFVMKDTTGDIKLTASNDFCNSLFHIIQVHNFYLVSGRDYITKRDSSHKNKQSSNYEIRVNKNTVICKCTNFNCSTVNDSTANETLQITKVTSEQGAGANLPLRNARSFYNRIW